MTEGITAVLLSREMTMGLKNGGRPVYQLTWREIDTTNNVITDRVYLTDIDSTFDNYIKWQPLTTASEPWGIYQGLRSVPRKSRSGLPVITADYAPVQLESLTWHQTQDFTDIIDAKSADTDNADTNTNTTTFWQLFE